MTEVYILFSGSYDDRGVVAVFSTLDKAMAYAPVGEWIKSKTTEYWYMWSGKEWYEIGLYRMDMPDE